MSITAAVPIIHANRKTRMLLFLAVYATATEHIAMVIVDIINLSLFIMLPSLLFIIRNHFYCSGRSICPMKIVPCVCDTNFHHISLSFKAIIYFCPQFVFFYGIQIICKRNTCQSNAQNWKLCQCYRRNITKIVARVLVAYLSLSVFTEAFFNEKYL